MSGSSLRHAGVRDWSISFLAGLTLLFVASYHGHFIRREYLLPLVLVVPSLLLLRRRAEPAAEGEPPDGVMPAATALSLCAILFIYSNALSYSWFYLDPWSRPTGGESWTIHSGPVLFALITAFLIPLAQAHAGWRRTFVLLAPFVFATWAGWSFLHATGGEPLYIDDHPTFQYRLWIFQRTFPQVVNYVPFWNAGMKELSGTATAANALGVALWPLWRAYSVAALYDTAIVLLYAVLVPALAALSIRAMGLSWRAAAIGAVLALGISQIHFLWLFHYGTVGANFTSAFVLPLMAGLYRVVAKDQRDWKSAALLVVSVSMLLLWPPGAIMVVPAALAVLLHARYWTTRKILFLGLCAIAVLALCSRELWIIFFDSDVATHPWVAAHKPAAWTVLADGWDRLRDHIRTAHPLLIMFGLGAPFVFWRHPMARWFIAPLLGFAALAGWGAILVPDLQLQRMAIPLFYVAIVPAAWLLDPWWCGATRRYVVLRALSLALFVVAGLTTVARFSNDGPAHFEPRPPVIDEMAAWVRSTTPPDGRVLLAGRAGHGYGGGHVPYLPILFQREMLVWDMCRAPVWTWSHGSPPLNVPEDEIVYRYLDLYAPVAIITLDDTWADWLSRHPERFEAGPRFEWYDTNFRTYLVRGAEPKGFVRGSGSVRADVNRLSVDLDNPQATAVLRYRWLDGLSCDAPATLHPERTPEGVEWIAVEPHGLRHVEVCFHHFFPWGMPHLSQASPAPSGFSALQSGHREDHPSRNDPWSDPSGAR